MIPDPPLGSGSNISFHVLPQHCLRECSQHKTMYLAHVSSWYVESGSHGFPCAHVGDGNKAGSYSIVGCVNEGVLPRYTIRSRHVGKLIIHAFSSYRTLANNYTFSRRTHDRLYFAWKVYVWNEERIRRLGTVCTELHLCLIVAKFHSR